MQARSLREANICFCLPAPIIKSGQRKISARRDPRQASVLPPSSISPDLAFTNPCRARRQLVGVKSPALADKLLAVLIQLASAALMLVSGPGDRSGVPALSGDAIPILFPSELSVSGPTAHIASFDGTQTRTYEITPEQLGLSQHSLAGIEIDSPQQSADLIRSLFSGSKANPAARDIVLLNAAAALWVAGKVEITRQGLPARLPLRADLCSSAAAADARSGLAAITASPQPPKNRAAQQLPDPIVLSHSCILPPRSENNSYDAASSCD